MISEFGEEKEENFDYVNIEELRKIKESHVKYSIEKFDNFLEKIIENIEVFIIPGNNDPVAKFWPQESMNKLYFRKCYNSENLNLVGNPFHYKINNLDFIGTNGFFFLKKNH